MDVGFLYGLTLSLFLVISNFFLLKWALKKTHQFFTSILLGGFVIRLAVVGIAVVIVKKYTSLEIRPFVFGLLGSYLIFQIIETVVLQKYLKRFNAARSTS